MKPSSRPSLLLALLAALVAAATASPARADDETRPDGGKAPAAAKSEDKTEPAAKDDAAQFDAVAAGDRVRLKFRGGRMLDGVVLAKDGWERRDPKDGWVAAKRTDKGAGLRLWWVQDLDGYQFVRAADIVELRSQGAVPQDELEALARRRKASADATDKRREAHDADRARMAAEEAKARALLEQVEQAKQEARELELQQAKEELQRRKGARWSELLEKFPPEKWTPDTPAEIQRRKIVLDVFPTEKEQEFLKLYDEWKEAWDAWKAAQDHADEPAAKAPATK